MRLRLLLRLRWNRLLPLILWLFAMSRLYTVVRNRVMSENSLNDTMTPLEDLPCSPRTFPALPDLEMLWQGDDGELNRAFDQVWRENEGMVGGYFRPCVESSDELNLYKTGIIVPYRDNRSHLETFVAYMHPFLQRQGIEYKIYVISQVFDDQPFSRGFLLNVGYLKAMAEGSWDCLVLHDAALLPEERGHHDYRCWKQPRHLSSRSSSFNFSLPHPEYFGGVAALKPRQFAISNGLSNQFPDWGGEDDGLVKRIKAAGYSIGRDQKQGRYFALSHEKQLHDSRSLGLLSDADKRFRTDGLKHIKYKVLDVQDMGLYTNYTVLRL